MTMTDTSADATIIKQPVWMASGVSSSLKPRSKTVHLDFELAGTLDLQDVGADVWVKHPDTRLILTGFAIDDGPAKVFDWNLDVNVCPAQFELLRAVLADAEIHAWNASFEYLVWNHHVARHHAMPALPLEQFHCTMATAANAGLPLDLGDAALAIGSSYQKDPQGKANMLRMARPRAFNPDGTPRWWHLESVPKLDALRAYNKADVEAERAISRRIPRMTQREREIWLVDQRMNDRGMPVDQLLLGDLSVLTVRELRRINREIEKTTKGEVTSSNQHTKLLSWLQNEGYQGEDLRKETVAHILNAPGFACMTRDGQRVLELRAEAAKTSTAKLKSVGAFSQRDGRARGLVQYAGAVRTLRWAGRGPQIQNFPRPVIKHVNEAIREIQAGMPAEGLEMFFGKPLDVVSSCLRGVFKAPPGYKFVVCDYHAIEAIVLAWLADFPALLDVFRRHEDVYSFTAWQVGSSNRQFGKVLRLGLGYQMGAAKFQKTAQGYGIFLTPLESENAVKAFRAANRPIVTLWRLYENAARQAIAYPDQQFLAGKVKFRMALKTGKLAGSLLIEKPSGGTLVYREASLHGGRIRYRGVHQTTRQWTDIDTYGAKLVENCTQAIARDLLADTMCLLEAHCLGALLATIHDEIVAQAPEQEAPMMLEVLKRFMSTPPAWAAGMPLSAAGYIADRYAKA